MAYRPGLQVPFGYGTITVSLSALRTHMLEEDQDPEFVERFIAWLDWCDGLIGYGGGTRDVQPDRDGFAPPGKSFHLRQLYANGERYSSAVDVVRINPSGGEHLTVRWSDVPKQGTALARVWGVHANVDQGAYPEAWHIQPTDRDGWQTWVDAGRPGLLLNYPFPGRNAPPVPPEEDDDMKIYLARSEDNSAHLRQGNRIQGSAFRSNENNHLKNLFDAGEAPEFYNPMTGQLIKSWWTIPSISETDLDLRVGYIMGDALEDVDPPGSR